jgi:hypothetical protein
MQNETKKKITEKTRETAARHGSRMQCGEDAEQEVEYMRERKAENRRKRKERGDRVGSKRIKTKE